MSEIVYYSPERIDTNNFGEILKEMEALLDEAIAEGDDGIYYAVDMTDTGYLSSAGLRSLTQMQKRLRAARGTFVLRNVSESVRDLLDVTGLSGYLPIE